MEFLIANLVSTIILALSRSEQRLIARLDRTDRGKEMMWKHQEAENCSSGDDLYKYIGLRPSLSIEKQPEKQAYVHWEDHRCT